MCTRYSGNALTTTIGHNNEHDILHHHHIKPLRNSTSLYFEPPVPPPFRRRPPPPTLIIEISQKLCIIHCHCPFLNHIYTSYSHPHRIRNKRKWQKQRPQDRKLFPKHPPQSPPRIPPTQSLMSQHTLQMRSGNSKRAARDL